MEFSFSFGFFAEKGKVGKREKRLPFGRESMEFSFPSGFFLLKKEKQAKEKRDCRSAGKAWNSLFHLVSFC